VNDAPVFGFQLAHLIRLRVQISIIFACFRLTGSCVRVDRMPNSGALLGGVAVTVSMNVATIRTSSTASMAKLTVSEANLFNGRVSGTHVDTPSKEQFAWVDLPSLIISASNSGSGRLVLRHT